MTPDPAAAAPALDELTITIVVDNATDTLSSIAPGIPQLPEMAYLLGGIPPSGQHDGHDCVVGFDHLCVACHGFSALATARQGGRTATVLFDFGPYGDVWLANADRLSVDLSSIEVLFLSHWHWDHSGGIPTVVAAIAGARRSAGREPLIVDVHPDRPDQRGILTPFDIFAMLPAEPTIEAIETAGGHVITHADVHSSARSSGSLPRSRTSPTMATSGAIRRNPATSRREVDPAIDTPHLASSGSLIATTAGASETSIHVPNARAPKLTARAHRSPSTRPVNSEP